MSRTATTEPRKRRARWARLLIPGLGFALGIAAAVAAAKSRGEPFRGVCRQETVAVVAQHSGKLRAIEQKYGTEVTPGVSLAVLEDADVLARQDALASERDSVARRLDTAVRQAEVDRSQRLSDLERDLLETRLRCADLLRERLSVEVRRKALEMTEPAAPVAEAGLVPIVPVSSESAALRRRFDMADAGNQKDVLDAQIALCEDRLAGLERSIAELPGRLDRAFEVDRLRSELAEAERAVAEAGEAARGVSVTSPAYGRIGVYRRKPGETVAAGETLVEIFDPERSFVLVVLGLDRIAELPPGQRVRVDFSGIDEKKPLSGLVAEVVSEAEAEAESAVTPGTLSARVKIVPAGRRWPVVPPGTTATVSPISR